MITSTHNKRVAKAVRLKKRAMREKDRRFLVEGVRGVVEAVVSATTVHEVFRTASSEERVDPGVRAAHRAGIPVHEVSSDVMTHLTSTVTPQGIVAVAEFVDGPLDSIPDDAGCVPVLYEVRDPGNAGAILRSADAAGAEAVVFTRSSVDVYNQKAVRASAGSLFHVPVVREVDVDATIGHLRDRGFGVLAAAADGDTSVYEADLSGPTVLLFGNEARGLPPEARGLADGTVRVPIAGRAESLNLAAAATLVLFESARQRAGGSPLAAIVAASAHDVRSPLAAVQGFAGTLLSRWDRLTEDQRRFMVEGIAHDAGRMERLITQLVDAARLAAGRLNLAPEPTDLLGCARAVADALRREDLDIGVAGEAVTVMADRARVKTILGALVEAARWFGEEGPVVVAVEPGPPPGVSVSRSGGGLDPAVIEDLFHARVPGTGGGSKVGLFVANGLVHAHGGSLRAESEGGIRFIMELPLDFLPP